jgi:predicted nucleic acid-binding protein
MGTLIDSSLWVDYFRPKTPRSIKEQTIKFTDDPDAMLCEPVRFEILRAAPLTQRKLVEQTFATLPLVTTPDRIWEIATKIGQACMDEGSVPKSLDLLIAAICLHHHLQVVTFDAHFGEIARVSPLKILLLKRVG